jgi:hypothetical protein
VKSSILPGLLGCLLFLTVPAYGQETPKFEKIRDVSPDKKFAARITCSSEPEDPEKIDSDLITAIDIVSLPAKEVVVSLGPGLGLENFKFVWSSDSKWFAFPFSEGNRVTETKVYNLRGDKFDEVNTDDLRADVKGNVRNEYIKPLHWMKPGTLSLEQVDIFRDGNGDDATFEFTVRFEKDGKFHVISKKKVPNKKE